MSLEADSENEAATPDGGNGINRLNTKKTEDRKMKEQIPIPSADGFHGVNRKQKKQHKELGEPLRIFDHRFSHLENHCNMQSKKARTTSPENTDMVTESSIDSKYDLPTPDYVPLKNNRHTAELAGAAEETKKLMTEIELAEAEKKEISAVKPQLRTKEEKKS